MDSQCYQIISISVGLSIGFDVGRYLKTSKANYKQILGHNEGICVFLSFHFLHLHFFALSSQAVIVVVVVDRGISIQGEVRNAKKKRVTQQLLCSKF